MPKHIFTVGMRVRARHNLIEGDYHKGNRTLAREGDIGHVESLYTRYDGRQGLHVKFDKHKWSGAVICDDWDVEPISDPLDQFVADVFSPEER